MKKTINSLLILAFCIFTLSGCGPKTPEQIAEEQAKQAEEQARIAARQELLTVKSNINEMIFTVPNNQVNSFWKVVINEMRKKSKYKPHPNQSFGAPRNVPTGISKGLAVHHIPQKEVIYFAYKNAFNEYLPKNNVNIVNYYDMWAQFEYDTQVSNLNTVITIRTPKILQERQFKHFLEWNWKKAPMDTESNLMADLNTVINHLNNTEIALHGARKKHVLLLNKHIKLDIPTVVTLLKDHLSKVSVKHFADQTDVKGELMDSSVTAILEPFKGGTRLSVVTYFSEPITVASRKEPMADLAALDEIKEYIEYDLIEGLK